MLTREIVPPATVGKSSLAPRRVACTTPGLPTTRVAGPVISNVSVLPALTIREISGVLPGRRIHQESCSTFSTSRIAPTAAAATGGVTPAVTAAAGAAAGGKAAAGAKRLRRRVHGLRIVAWRRRHGNQGHGRRLHGRQVLARLDQGRFHALHSSMRRFFSACAESRPAGT